MTTKVGDLKASGDENDHSGGASDGIAWKDLTAAELAAGPPVLVTADGPPVSTGKKPPEDDSGRASSKATCVEDAGASAAGVPRSGSDPSLAGQVVRLRAELAKTVEEYEARLNKGVPQKARDVLIEASSYLSAREDLTHSAKAYSDDLVRRMRAVLAEPCASPTQFTGGLAMGNETPNNRPLRTSEAQPAPKATCGWCKGNPIGHCAICQAKPSGPETYADEEYAGPLSNVDEEPERDRFAHRTSPLGDFGCDRAECIADRYELAMRDKEQRSGEDPFAGNEAHWQPLYEACRDAVRAWERDNATCSHDVTLAMQALKIATTQAGQPRRERAKPDGG